MSTSATTSRIPTTAPSCRQTTRSPPTAAGVYYLAISSFNNDPLSSSGEIFPNEPLHLSARADGPWRERSGEQLERRGRRAQGARTRLDITGATLCPTNEPPDCSLSVASPSVVQWGTASPRSRSTGVTDPNGDPIEITVDSIFQDEPVCGLLDPCPDGKGVGTATARVRRQARLLGLHGNGRVYRDRLHRRRRERRRVQRKVTVGVKSLICGPTARAGWVLVRFDPEGTEPGCFVACSGASYSELFEACGDR